jgi:acyl-CoA synthetase (AMP-forming)/AMP-acid ligase II
VLNLFYFGGWTAVGYRFATICWDIGGTVVIYPGANQWESFHCAEISHSVVTPPLLAEILASPREALKRNDAMQLFVTAGMLSDQTWQEARERLTSRILTYVGSTEAGAYTLTPLESPEDLRWHRVLPGREVQFVDTEDRPLPIGEIGHMRVRLPTSAHGYVDDEVASRQSFRHGYFYPGDLGFFREDGQLALCGRETDVANIRGNKIATGHIEQEMQRELGVDGVCLFSVTDPGIEEDVQIAIEAGQPLDESGVTAAVAGALPGISSARVHFVTSMPRNYLGKIRRELLLEQLVRQEPGLRIILHKPDKA